MTNTQPLPPAPDLVLRIGFAGNRDLPSDVGPLNRSLDRVLGVLAKRLAEIRAEVHTVGKAPTITRFYSNKQPTLRLITGLAEGSDMLAARALGRLSNPGARAEHAGVLPFDLEQYRDSRKAEFRASFDELAGQCAYVLALDGRYVAGDAGKLYRARAYRAQSTVLLRQADILLASADPEGACKAGGTLETIRAALAFDLPVVFIHAGSGKVQLLEPGTDLASALAGAADAPGWEEGLRSWINDIVADPDTGSGSDVAQERGSEAKAPLHGERLLEEFFKAENLPPSEISPGGKSGRKASWREKLWMQVASWFRPKDASVPAPDPPISAYDDYRRRARSLNYHYSGLYRGTFVLNYVLAATAVALAALSLVLLGRTRTDAAESVEAVLRSHPLLITVAAEPITNGAVAPGATNRGTTLGGAAGSLPAASSHVSVLFLSLLFLGAMKFAVVVFIFRNTHQANHGDWNDKAVDYRYLAERLRSLFYLPRVGSFQPPAAAPPQYASRVVRQSAVDWLFEAIVRSVPPSVLLSRNEAVSVGDGTSYTIPVIHVDAAWVLADVRDRWLGGQIAYHSRNARTMEGLSRFAERWGKRLNVAVIAAVAIDVTILLCSLFHLFPEGVSQRLHTTAPALMFLAALLPAAVASLNGIRFQSECGRLADRSAIVRVILGGRERVPQPSGRLKEALCLSKRIESARQNPASDPGAWSIEVLRLSEAIARDLVQEVAEWSVLYSKEVVEP